MSLPFPSPTIPIESRAEVLLGYIDYFRSVVADKFSGLDESEIHTSRLPSGWSPAGLVNHLAAMERRWFVWGFAGENVPDPWRDSAPDSDHWYVDPDATSDELISLMHSGGTTTRAIVLAHGLEDIGAPSDRWDAADPPTLERVLLHVIQEYARHAGHLDIVRELIDGTTGEE